MISEKEKGEIRQSYRLAKDKEEQIQVLAELNATDAATIRGICYEGGCYPIGPDEIIQAANKIIEKNLSFGEVRNYGAAWKDFGARQAKKIFKDFCYKPWGNWEDPDKIEQAAQLAGKALDKRKKAFDLEYHKPKEILPAPAAAAASFTDEQAGILIAGLLSLLAEQRAQEAALAHRIDLKHEQAKQLLQSAEDDTEELNRLTAEIARGKMLLDQLQETVKEVKNGQNQ